MINEFIKRIITGIIFCGILLGAYILNPIYFSICLSIILITILVLEWPKLIPISTKIFWLITPLYPIAPFAVLIYLNHMYYYRDPIVPLYPFFISFVCDTGSFVMGKLFGKHKVCPNISPGKSWEGLWGGFIAISLINFFVATHSKMLSKWLFLHGTFNTIAFSLILTIVAFCGDIFISFLKRSKKIKDTGNILPGHGGFLDRFDSVLFVTLVLLPLFMLYR
jgi:phosphatidate cytidylyltransferase